jgi:hypothetical protein
MPEQPKDNPEGRSKLKAVLASPYFLPAATILPAVLSYVLQRRVKTQAAPEAEVLAQRIRKGGLGMTIDPTAKQPMNPLAAAARYGTPHVGPPEKLPNELRTIVYPFPTEMRNVGSRAIGNVPLFAGSKSKLDEINRIRNTVGPGAAPYSVSAAEHVNPYYMFRHPEEQLAFAQRRMHQKHQAGYVLKPIVTYGKTAPMTEAHNLVDEYNKLYTFSHRDPIPEFEALRPWLRESPAPHFRELAESKNGLNLYNIMELLKATPDPEFLGKVLQHAPESMKNPLMAQALVHAPETMFVQDRIPLTGEYRMHVYNGRIMRRTTVPRHDRLKGALALAGHKSDFERKLEDHVEQHILGKMAPEDTHNRMLSLDVGVKEDGTPIILEANPMGWSGFLAGRGAAAIPSAVNMNRFVSELSGRETVPLAAAKSLMTGALGAGAAYGAQRLAGDDQANAS